jgi:hypothetical protein
MDRTHFPIIGTPQKKSREFFQCPVSSSNISRAVARSGVEPPMRSSLAARDRYYTGQSATEQRAG